MQFCPYPYSLRTSVLKKEFQMVEARYRSVAQNLAGARVREIDEGLRSYLLGVYN